MSASLHYQLCHSLVVFGGLGVKSRPGFWPSHLFPNGF